MHKSLYLSTILLFFLGVFFVFDPVFAESDSCRNVVAFRNQGLARFASAEVFGVWSDNWEQTDADWDAGFDLLAFTDDCFDDHEGTLRIGFDAEDRQDTVLSYSAVINAGVNINGFLYEDEVENILYSGSNVFGYIADIEALSRVQNYIKHIDPERGIVFINYPDQPELGVTKGEQFSGSVVRFAKPPHEGTELLSSTYLLYDYRTGYMQYSLPVAYEWPSFPEIKSVVDQYKQAARSVSKECSLEFTDDDMIRGVLFPNGDWHMRITSTLENCPPVFSASLDTDDRVTNEISDLPVFGTYDIVAHEPVVRIFPRGILTTARTEQLAFDYFKDFLGLLIMFCGVVLFGVVMIHYLVFDKDLKHFLFHKK